MRAGEGLDGWGESWCGTGCAVGPGRGEKAAGCGGAAGVVGALWSGAVPPERTGGDEQCSIHGTDSGGARPG